MKTRQNLKLIEDNLLKENETDDRVKIARLVQKLVDAGLGLPDRPWHDWDEWGKVLNDHSPVRRQHPLSLEKPSPKGRCAPHETEA